jgi:von Willebrand factor type A domain
MDASQEEIKTTEAGARKKGQRNSVGDRSFLEKYKSLFGGSLFLAVAFHVLLLIGFGSYTLFKGSAPRMPFTSEGGVPAEDAGMEAPPEVAPETMEESPTESSSTPSDAPAMETDMVLAVSGVVSPAMSLNAAPPVLAPAASTSSDKLMSKPGNRSGVKASSVNFFGVKGEGTNVCFVIDLSDSMLEEERGGVAGFAAVKNNLKQMIRSLDEGTRFNVVAYGATGADLFQSASVPASAEMKKLAEEFISKYNLSSERRGTIDNKYRPKIPEFGIIQGDKGTGKITTRLDLGLLAAFEGLADTIFLITDGKAPVVAEDRRDEARQVMKDAVISSEDRAKYEKDIAEWRKEYEKYAAEMKAYREKYKDLLAKKEQKTAEAKAKGGGKVREGAGVDYGVRIPGLPNPPQEPKQPLLPQPKVGNKAVQAAGQVYDEAALIRRIREVYTDFYKKADAPTPSIHTVGYMSKPNETKFLQALASKNNGTFKAISAPIK